MPTTNYYTIDGEIIAERVSGGARREYFPDALGSISATMSANAIENRFSYKPYGDMLAKTGAAADPLFTWVGSLGYRHTDRHWSEQYVRARAYSDTLGRWTTIDQLWPVELPFTYCSSNPLSKSDATGLQGGKKKKKAPPSPKTTAKKIDCKKECDKWKGVPGNVSGLPAGTQGVVICVGMGKKHKCPCYVGASPNPNLIGCVLAHEEEHIRHGDEICPGTNPFNVADSTAKNQKQLDAQECNARFPHIDCLSKCAGSDRDCALTMQLKCQQAKNLCASGGVTIPSPIVGLCRIVGVPLP